MASTVTSFSAVVNGEQLHAEAFERSEAAERYEDAVEKGDTPMLLECQGDGLCTASLGNLLPNTEAVIEITLASVLAFDDGTVRLTVPTVIADRYSGNGGQGRLPDYAKVETNFFAEYPCRIAFEITGLLADRPVTCPTHPSRTERTGGTLKVELLKVYADRSIMLVFDEVPAPNLAFTKTIRSTLCFTNL